MPSELPKVTAYIQPETRAALDAASKALGESRSKLVAELLDAAVPVLRAVTDAANVVANVGDMQREAMAKLADEVAPMKDQAEDLLSQFLEATNKLGSPDPRPSNTGVRISTDPHDSGKSPSPGTGGKTGGKG
jgi:hypothetical protein